MARLLLLLLLLLGILSQPVQGQINMDSLAQINQLKGKIWSITAARIWHDRGLKTPPAEWLTKKDFDDWAERTGEKDQSGLVNLRGAVTIAAAKQSPSPAKLQQLIVAEIKKSKLGVKVDTVKLKDNFAGANLGSPPLAGNPQLRVIPDTHGADIDTESDNPVKQQADSSATQQKDPKTGPPKHNSASNYFTSEAIMTGLLGLFVGLTTGLLAGLRLAGRTKADARDDGSSQRLDRDPHAAFNGYKTEAERMRADAQHSRPSERASTSSLPLPAVTRSNSDNQQAKSEGPSSQPLKSSASAVIPRYAAAQEGGRIEEHKTTSEPLSQLPIEFTQEDNTNRAKFRLNPYANQERLIGDGIKQLGEYFDFALPSRITAIKDAGNGWLRRQGDNWVVETKAKLDVH